MAHPRTSAIHQFDPLTGIHHHFVLIRVLIKVAGEGRPIVAELA